MFGSLHEDPNEAQEIDRTITYQSAKKLPDELRAILKVVQAGGGMAKVEKHKMIGGNESSACDYCDSEHSDFEYKNRS